MKILTLSNYFPEHIGGIEVVAMNLVKHWRVHHQVRWMACEDKQHPHHCTADDLPLPAFNFAETKLGFPYPIPLGNSFLKILRQVQECDVVHIHDCLYLASLFAFIVSRWYDKPLLVTQHVALVPYPQAYKNIMQRIAYRVVGNWVLRNSESVVFISERVRTWFEDFIRFHNKITLIRNGVDHGIFFPADSEERRISRTQLGFSADDFVLLFVGRFTQKKGLDTIYKIANARPDLHWIMIGRDELDPRAWQLSNVQVLSPQPQALLRQYYISADLFMLPSVGEGFPLALQESLSCGLPAAVTKEIADYIPDAPLIQIDANSLTQILQTLDNVLTTPEQLLHLRDVAAEHAKLWDWVSVAHQYELLFNELITSVQ